jgi:hypothetical protein
MMPKVEIKPGPELDAEIAKACGFTGVIRPASLNQEAGFYRHHPDGTRRIFLWSPSTDLNAAFEAAEKCGLFDDVRVSLRRHSDGRWFYDDPRRMWFNTPWQLYQATIPLAICAAIIEYAERKNAQA